MKLSIKNMVCPRCIAAVEQVLQDMELQPVQVQLGEAVIERELSDVEMISLNVRLKSIGFEIVEDNKLQLIEKIKALVINQIHHSNEGQLIFSELLSRSLNRDYSGLSKLFSAFEGITIEQFIILQKIEKAKELLLYNELTLSEIAYKMGYSSVAHLSAQFRKTTGFTPTVFRKQGNALRQPLDNVAKNL